MNVCFSLLDHAQIPMANLLIRSLQSSKLGGQIIIYVKSGIHYSNPDKQVHLVYFKVAEDNEHFPFYDKIQAASICEQEQENAFLWVDIDSVFFRLDPYDFRTPMSINPVDKRNVGLPSDKKTDAFWSIILKEIGLSSKVYCSHTINATFSKEAIHPYYNIGMVYLDPSFALFTKTYNIMKTMLVNSSFLKLLESSPLHRIFLHQMIFSALVIKNIPFETIYPLAEGYNIPLHLIDDVVKYFENEPPFSIRYDTYFNHHSWPSILTKPMELKEEQLKLRWIYK